MKDNLVLTRFSGFGLVGNKKLTNLRKSKLSGSYGKARRGFSIVNYLDEALIVTGGESGEPLNSVCKFDMVGQSWVDLTPMNFSRKFHTSCIQGKSLYVLGGHDIKTGLENGPRAKCRWFIRDFLAVD